MLEDGMLPIRLLPSPTIRRGLAVVAVVLAGPLLARCEREAPPPAAPEAPSPAAAPTPAAAVSLTRADIIAAAARAASAYAAGDTSRGADALVGRTFSIRTAFACGPLTEAAIQAGASAGVARAGWGAERKTIELTLTPDDWAGSALMASPDSDEGWEAVEGFWLARPWLASEDCPAVSSDPLQGAAEAPASQTVGLAAVFSREASRTGRRNGRAYQFTVRAPRDQPAPAAPATGYRLVLEGRVTGFPDGRAFRCRAPGPDQRPVCVAAVQLDRVAFATADGESLSEWRTGG